jgi:predicted Rdx family selenoprotein
MILYYLISGSFEIQVNGKEIFSKLKRGAMPDFEEVIECVSIPVCRMYPLDIKAWLALL